MKLLVILSIITSCYSACWITCVPNIVSENIQAQKDINTSFSQLTQSLNSLDSAYNDYLSAYKEQNKLLKKLQDLRAYNSKKLDEVNFLLESTNSLLDIKINEMGENNAK
ncbi:hypothetical protein [Helicobacter sp. MIT 14-3879]|uniref:hypothetical protein n=1 Tax=Helicobacter sp. MIT 14-3879 TaxID=2040649 RepID=UPI000E1F3FA7|nr:hypothetical protein [Helicobacter sp. MIT 14-3879]RDU61843.1 hypothetical protein CQA44_07910 [Helicobacter sp. MIT 14-3879]